MGVFALALTALLAAPCAALAEATTPSGTGTPAAEEEEAAGGRTSVGLEEVAGSPGGQTSGVGRISGLSTLIGGVINAILGLVGVVFFVLMIYAGFLWMTAAGNEERVTKAKSIFVTSVIGLIVIIGAYYILDFVFDAIYSSIGAETAAEPAT